MDNREIAGTLARLSTSTTSRVKPASAMFGHRPVRLELGVAAHGPVGRHRHQRQPDGGDHHAGHHRREEPDDPGEERGDQQADQRRTHHRTEHRRHPAALGGDRHQGGDAGERGALDQRQLRPEPRDAHRLEDGRQATDEQAAGDQQTQLRRRDTGRRADDQRRGDDPAVHGEDVLGAEAQALADPQELVLRPLRGDLRTRCAHDPTPQQNPAMPTQAASAVPASARWTVASIRPYGRSAA